MSIILFPSHYVNYVFHIIYTTRVHVSDHSFLSAIYCFFMFQKLPDESGKSPPSSPRGQKRSHEDVPESEEASASKRLTT